MSIVGPWPELIATFRDSLPTPAVPAAHGAVERLTASPAPASSPDFAWRREKVAVFVNGCFWHGHDCGKNIRPHQNAERWRRKISRTRRTDRRVGRTLRRMGWRVVQIFECCLRKRLEACIRRLARLLAGRRSTTAADRPPRHCSFAGRAPGGCYLPADAIFLYPVLYRAHDGEVQTHARRSHGGTASVCRAIPLLPSRPAASADAVLARIGRNCVRRT